MRQQFYFALPSDRFFSVESLEYQAVDSFALVFRALEVLYAYFCCQASLDEDLLLCGTSVLKIAFFLLPVLSLLSSVPSFASLLMSFPLLFPPRSASPLFPFLLPHSRLLRSSFPRAPHAAPLVCRSYASASHVILPSLLLKRVISLLLCVSGGILLRLRGGLE